ncbi:hypothetical protein GF373_13465 [bacterium]|nr:hypothetical protein [bacterium]
MKKGLFVLGVLLLLPAICSAQLFTPGNVVFADPVDDRIVELSLNDSTMEAELVQILDWPLLDTKRRRPLGLDISPTGTVFVGVTGEPTSVTEEVEFPTGRVEIVAFRPDGTREDYLNVAPTNKATFLSCYAPNEVFVMSNAQDAEMSYFYRVRVDGEKVVETTEFLLSELENVYGEALQLPDGRILASGQNGDDPGIKVFDQDGGEPVGYFVEEGNFRSLAYIPELDKIIALRTDQQTIARFDMEGNIEDELNLGDLFYPNLWGVAHIPGTTRIIFGSHNGPAATRNYIGTIDVSDFASQIEEYLISGFESVGLDPGHQFNSLFNMAVVTEPTQIMGWDLY